MASKIDSTKISPTAHITAHAWDLLGISNAEHFVDQKFKFFFNIFRTLALPYFANKQNDYIYFMLEPRHRAIDYFIISKFSYKQIVELACGLSPRGMTFTENPEFTYIESDLPKMLKLKKDKVKKIYEKKKLKRANHKFVAVDVMHENLAEKLSSVVNKNEKTIVITEGLTPYFDMEHLRKIFTNIAKFLKSNGGGVYITDIYHEEDMKRNFLNSTAINYFLKIIQANFRIDIDNSDEAQRFLKDCGFDFVEALNPLQFSKQLGLKHKIPQSKNVATIYLAHVF